MGTEENLRSVLTLCAATLAGNRREPASADTGRVSVTSLVFMLVAADAVHVWLHVIPFSYSCVKYLMCCMCRVTWERSGAVA